jgi:hypothetical protein
LRTIIGIEIRAVSVASKVVASVIVASVIVASVIIELDSRTIIGIET